jgi:phage major head subunit gpT-like protein
MGIESTSTLTALKTRVHKDFQAAMTSAQPWWNGEGKGVMTSLPVLFSLATFAWLAEMSGAVEWLGSREVDRVKERSFQAPVKTYEKTVGVDTEKLEDNENAERAGAAIVTAGVIAGAIGEVMARLPDDLYVFTLQNGQSITAYDGQNLYDTDHPMVLDGAAGTQSNYEASGFALTQPNFITARARLMSFKGENGLPRPYAGKLVLEVPPALEAAARTIVEAESISTGGTNITRGLAEVRVNPRLAGQDTTWYLHLVGGPGIGAIVFLQRRAPRMVMKTGPQEDNVFWDREAIFGADTRAAVAPGAWWKTFKAAA